MSAILFLVVAMATASASEHDELFEAFRSRYKRDYHVRELGYRRSVYADNMNYINAHNARAADGEHTFTLRENQFTDMTNEEFRAFRAGEDLVRRELQQEDQDELWKRSGRSKRSGRTKRSDEVDWRTKGLVTPVKNQGQCGAGWVFAAVGALEGQHAMATGHLVSLSEQNVMDCAKKNLKTDSSGCNGGLITHAFEYVQLNNGIATEASYPCKARASNTCLFDSATQGATCTGYSDIKSGDEYALQQAVFKYGPIAATIDSSRSSFQSYAAGVYCDPGCGNGYSTLDHAVLIVGYGTEMGQDYWIVKNSWGSTWGMGGYIHMARNMNNHCGIASMASYPTGAT